MNKHDDDSWRLNARAITKYNPAYRTAPNKYENDEWIGFFQLGKTFKGTAFTFQLYLETEKLYIEAVRRFVQFHHCENIMLKNIEKKDISEYTHDDRQELFDVYNSLKEDCVLNEGELETTVKLILRELIWCEIHCGCSPGTAIRFGYDFYMYFNSTKDMSILLNDIKEIGLYAS